MDNNEISRGEKHGLHPDCFNGLVRCKAETFMGKNLFPRKKTLAYHVTENIPSTCFRKGP